MCAGRDPACGVRAPSLVRSVLAGVAQPESGEEESPTAEGYRGAAGPGVGHCPDLPSPVVFRSIEITPINVPRGSWSSGH